MQTEKTQQRKSRSNINWKKVAMQTGKIAAISALNGAAFTLGGLLMSRVTQGYGEDLLSACDNVVPMKKSI